MVSIFDVPRSPQITHLPYLPSGVLPSATQCFHPKTDQIRPIDKNGKLSILSWNIYKQNKSGWQADLDKFSQHAQVMLLQEVKLTNVFDRYVKSRRWQANHVNAFKVFKSSSGVLLAGKSPAISTCAYVKAEPYLQLPKSSIISRYALSNQQELMVVNVHLVNFTLGVEDFSEQMDELMMHLTAFDGPIILAGDFNTWNASRVSVIHHMIQQLGLREVSYHNDTRRRFINGLPLDHIYYRGVTLEKAEVYDTKASDHNPILAKFKLKQ